MSLHFKRFVTNLLLSGSLAIVLLVFLSVSNRIRLFDTMEHRMNDLMMQLRKEKVADSPIVIVWIDDDSVMSYGFRSPTPRRLLADLIAALAKAQASVIGLDILLDLPHIESDDDALATAILQSQTPVVLATPELNDRQNLSEHHQQNLVPPFRQHNISGFSEVMAGASDIVRWLRVAESQQQNGSLVSEVYRLHYGEPVDTQSLRTAEMPYGWLRLNFWKPATLITSSNPAFQNFSALEVPYLPDVIFKDKIVLIGSGIASLGDTFLTPFSSGGNQFQLAFGVELHALALEMLLNQRLLHHAEKSWVNVLLFSSLLSIFIAALYLRPLASVLFFVAIWGVWTFVAFYLFIQRGLLIQVVGPWTMMLLAFLLAQAGAIFKGQKQTRFIRSTFKQYVSPEVVDTLLKHPEQLELGGKLTPVSIIFTDLEGFTSIAEQLSPQDMVARLNEYLEAMNNPIFEERGTLDKYIGDAIMAYYGAPVDQDDQADRACRSAVLMQLALQDLNRKWRLQDFIPFKMRIGIHTSKVVVGNIGSRTKMDYTLIGDGVNIAARLEGVNKLFGTQVIVSDDVLAQTSIATITRQLGRIQVKGRGGAVEIYQLFGADGLEYLSADADLINAYEQALALFYQRDFVAAQNSFRKLSEGGDSASSFLQLQCAKFIATPPAASWDGAISGGV